MAKGQKKFVDLDGDEFVFKTITTTVLPDKVAQKYAVPEGRLSKFACAEFGNVDLTKIDLAFAEQLAEKGYLVKLP